MPPQQTTSASKSDAALLSPVLTIGLVKATRDALAEKNAAGPMAVPARNVWSLLQRSVTATPALTNLLARTE
jgi:hypothetical protein